MDADILKIIISSSDISIQSESKNQWQFVINHEHQFPPTKEILIHGLSKTFTKLLMYKISQEAYQRYSVRLNIIDTLRDWSRVKGDIGNLPIFQDSEQSCNFLTFLLNKYLTEDILNNYDNNDDLIWIAEILLNTVIKKSLMKCFEKVIEKMISLDQTQNSEKFLQYVISISDDKLKLKSNLIEKIYTRQKSLFIEKPLKDCFVTYCSDQSNRSLTKMNFLFTKIAENPSLFLLVSNQLKEIFVMTKYAQTAQNFIQNVLKKIIMHCHKYNKDILDLYPLHLQFCVVLLRIKPYYHTQKSKDYTIKTLKQIFLINHNDALILLSHFPDWLPSYLEFLMTLNN